jgi:hypothetical protein
MANTQTQQWTWEWIGGGYNSCTASSREEALSKAMEMTTGPARLVPDISTIRPVTDAEMRAIERSWAAAFD